MNSEKKHNLTINMAFFVMIFITCCCILWVCYIQDVFIWGNGNNNIMMSCNVIDSDNYDMIISSRFENPELLGLNYNGYALPFDSDSSYFLASQNMYNSSWEGVISHPNCEVLFCDDDLLNDKSSALSQGHIFTGLIYNETTYAPFNIVFTGMPIMNLTTSHEEGGEIYGSLTVFDLNNTSKPIQNSYCSFHIRGNTSRNYDKKSYKLELLNNDGSTNKLSFLGMRKDDDWILNAMYTDYNKLRDKLSTELWEIISSSNPRVNETGSHLEYIEVVCDNIYLGMYGLMEPVDSKQLSLGSKDILYKTSSWTFPSSDDLYQAQDQLSYDSLEIKYPNTSYNGIWKPMALFTEIFWENTTVYHAEASNITNITNVIDLYIFNQLTWNDDGGLKNQYLAARQKSDKYEFTIIPWDFDYTFGNGWAGDVKNCTLFFTDRIESILPWRQYTWDNYNSNSQQKLYVETVSRWEELKHLGVNAPTLLEILYENSYYINNSGAFTREVTKWPDADNTDDITNLQIFITEHFDFLDKYFTSLSVTQ